jgi:hypothetical protein
MVRQRVCIVDRRQPAGASAAERSGWPIGVVVAAHWVAHGAGTEPDADNMIDAVASGLIELGDPWTLTERGRAALAAHGWL